MRILLGVDNSKVSGGTLQAIVAQFRPENTIVLVLHVLQPLTLSAQPEMAQGYDPDLEVHKEPARQFVERKADELREAGFRVTTAVEVGDTIDVILDSAAKWSADLIVVGNHEPKGIQSLLRSNVAESVARRAKCSVEIVRTPTRD